MRSRKATGPVTDSVNGPRADLLASNRRVADKSQAKKQGPRVSLSPMQSAFLAGLVDLAQRETGDEGRGRESARCILHDIAERSKPCTVAAQ
jgi:hypothetical protein